MRFIEIPALITEDIEDPSIVDITEPITVSISGTTMTIDGGSKVSGEATVTLTGDTTVNAFTLQNIRTPSLHKISVKTNNKGNFTYVPNNTVTASSVSTTTKTGSDFEILLITTNGGETYVDFDMADYTSPALYTSNALTGFDISELTSTYGATAKLYKPGETLPLTTVSATTGGGIGFGSGVESIPGDVTYTLEVTDDLGRTSRYDLPRKWISYAMSSPGFEKLELAGNEYTSTTIVPNLTPSSKAKVFRTNNHGYMGINFKIQGRNSTNDAWTDIANADEDDEVLAFGDYLYHRVWVKPTAKATTTVSSSNVVTLTLTDFTEENVTTSFTGADPFDINESTNTYVFEETTKIGTVPYTVTLGTETYTNAVTATTEGTAYDYVTLAFANPTLSLTTSNVTISSAKLYRDDVLFHTYGTESNVVLRSDQTGTYQAIVNDVYYSNRVTPDFTTTRSVSAPQLEFDGYNRLNLSNSTPTSTTLGLPDGTTRDLTTQSNVYIYETGTYTANVQTSDTFAYLSNVVTSQPSQNSADVGPTFTFDGYNRLNLSNLTQTSSSLRFGSNTYDTNTASNVYVTDAGEYKLEARDANTFVMSNVYVDAVDTTTFTLAFHHGAFSASDYSGAYSTVGAAATAGFVYSDTTPATYTWGTLNSVDTSTTGQTGYTWTPTSDITADVLMVAGGGGGSDSNGGGGGAGGLVYNASQNLSGTKTIVVGAGGTKGIDWHDTGTFAEPGGNTSFTGLDTAIGGGAGTQYTNYPDSGTRRNGGSGGGAAGSSDNNLDSGGTGISGQGYAGGGGKRYSGGGGGGAGGAGGDGVYDGDSGSGGVGLDYSSIFGTTYGDDGWFAGGGAGATGGTASGGKGGGGDGGDATGSSRVAAQAHTGGGGSGGSGTTYPNSDGGSGIVLIKKLGPINPPALTFDGYNKLTIENDGNGDTGMKNVTISGGPWDNHTFKPDDNAQKGKFQWDLWLNTANYQIGNKHNLEYVPGYGWYVLNQDGTGFGDVTPTSATSGTYLDGNGVSQTFSTNLASSSGGVLSIAHTAGTMTVNESDFFEGGIFPPKVGSLESVTIKKDGVAFATTTSNTVYIRDTGTYTAEVKGSGAYAIELSNVVTGTVSQHPADVVPSLTYDNYNKITLENMNYEDTATVTVPNESTYNLGTAKTMYVKDTGEYVFKISGTDKYMESNVYVSSVDLAGAPTKPIDFDGYNKLTLIDAGSNVSANVTYFSNTYELGSANVLYINGAGTYDLEMSGSNVFALSSNVVGTVSQQHSTDVVPSLTFDNYNKLTLENFTTTESDTRTAKLTDPNDVEYSLGQTQNDIYIEDTGEYILEVTNSDQSAVVTKNVGTVQIPLTNNTIGSHISDSITSGTLNTLKTYVLDIHDGSIADSGFSMLGATKINGGDRWICYTARLPSHSTTTKLYFYNIDTGDTYSENTQNNSSGGYNDFQLNDFHEIAPNKLVVAYNNIITFYTYSNGTFSIISSSTKTLTQDSSGNGLDGNYRAPAVNSRLAIRRDDDNNVTELAVHTGGTNGTGGSRDWQGYNHVAKIHYWNYNHTTDTMSYQYIDLGWTNFLNSATTRSAQLSFIPDSTTDLLLVLGNSDGSREPYRTVMKRFRLSGSVGSKASSTINSLGAFNSDYGPTSISYLKNTDNSVAKIILHMSQATFSGNSWWKLDTDLTNRTSLSSPYPNAWSVGFTYYMTGPARLEFPINDRYSAVCYSTGTFNVANSIAPKMIIYDTYDTSNYGYVSYDPGISTIHTSNTTDITGPASIHRGQCVVTNSNNSKITYIVPITHSSQTQTTEGFYIYEFGLDSLPSLTYDMYNKLSIENITPTSTRLTYGSNTYEIGTATDVYIEDAGTYKFATGDANTFMLVSNVVGTVSQHPEDVVPSLTYDTSNKLSIENLTPTSTILTDPNGSSFDIGTATDVYIRDSGTYSIASKDANTFLLASNTVTGTPTGTTYVYDSNTFTTPSQTYDTTKTITVSNVPSMLTDVVGKIYKGSTAYTIHATTSSTNVIIENAGTYVSVFTTATQAFLTNAIDATQPTITSDDTTIEDEGFIPGSTAVPTETTTDAPSVTLDATDTTVTDPTLDLDFTTTLPRTLKRYNGVTNSSIGVRFNRRESNKKRIEKSISIPTSFSAELTANNASSPTTLTVTVANSKFVINGDETPTLGFIRGETYTFDQSDASNSGHPLVLATSEDGATQYTTGWTTTPSSPDYVPGVSGAQGTFIVPYDVPDTIYYKCNVHPNMGGEINTTFGNVFSLGDFTVAANTHVSGEYTLATNYDGTTSNLYVNGTLITQTTPSPAISAGVKDFILGKEFDGYVKNFKFWNYAKRFRPPGIYPQTLPSLDSTSLFHTYLYTWRKTEGTLEVYDIKVNDGSDNQGQWWSDVSNDPAYYHAIAVDKVTNTWEDYGSSHPFEDPVENADGTILVTDGPDWFVPESL
jgi:hypothetical protein